MEYFRNPYLRWAGTASALLVALAVNAQPSAAAIPQGPPVVRLSRVNGDVAVRRADSGSTVGARTNAPLETSDMLSTGRNGRAEMQFDNTTFVRAGANSHARISRIGASASSVQLGRGTVMLRQLPNSRTHAFIETPGATIRPQRLGSTRVTVLNNGNTLVTVRSGSAVVTTTRQVVRTIVPGQSVLVEGSSYNPVFAPAPLLGVDAFDSWNNGIDQVESPYNGFGLGYPNPALVGVPQLSQYGQWVNSPQYGQVWAPSNEPPGWAPYQNGNWTYAPGYGNTWVGNEPWGWAPYHYGNWVYQPNVVPGNSWAWAPGQVTNSSSAWLPATVAFLSLLGGANPQSALTAGLESSLATDCGVNPYGFGANPYAYGGTPYGYSPYGVAPGYGGCNGAYPYNSVAPGYVGWVPLAPGEPISPWWGNWMNPVAYAGPTMYSQYSQPIQTVSYSRVVNIYRNFRAPNGVTIVTTRNFVNGRVVRVPLTTVRTQVRNIVVYRHALPFAPTRAMLGTRSSIATNPALFRRFSTPRQPLAFAVARSRTVAVAARAYRLPVHATTIRSHTAIRPNGSVVHARTAVRPNGAIVHGRTVVRPNSTTHVRTVVRPHSVTHMRTTVGPRGTTHVRTTVPRPLARPVTHPVMMHPVTHPVMMHPVTRPVMMHPVTRPAPVYRQPRPLARPGGMARPVARPHPVAAHPAHAPRPAAPKDAGHEKQPG